MFFFTSNFGITLQRGSRLELVAYADADYASKATDRRSVSGGASSLRNQSKVFSTSPVVRSS